MIAHINITRFKSNIINCNGIEFNLQNKQDGVKWRRDATTFVGAGAGAGAGSGRAHAL